MSAPRSIMRSVSAAMMLILLGMAPATAQDDGCRCDCAEFDALRATVPAVRERCSAECLHYPNSMYCVTDAAQARGLDQNRLVEDVSACPTRCEEVRADRSPSALCRDAVWSLRKTCPASGGITDGDIVEMVDWTVRELPEPMKTQLRDATLEQLRSSDSETRERWVETMRQARQAQADAAGQ